MEINRLPYSSFGIPSRQKENMAISSTLSQQRRNKTRTLESELMTNVLQPRMERMGGKKTILGTSVMQGSKEVAGGAQIAAVSFGGRSKGSRACPD